MEYGKNILPQDAVMYELQNADIQNGILHMSPGGHLKYTFTEADIVTLSEYIRVSLITDISTDRYIPKVRAHIHLETEDGIFYNNSLYPTGASSGVYTQELHMKAGSYRAFTFEIFAEEAITFTMWELCAEAADEDIKTVIEGVEQSLPRLLFDYNMRPLVINQDEMSIALITFKLLDHTDLQGHFQMAYVASEACTLTLRFKDNGATELFAPLLYDLHAGRGSVGVPHAYLDRLAGIHAVNVTAQINTGTLAIDTRGILFTIDGGYLAERVIDVGVDMRDISIRQLAASYGPDEIWIVGIESGEVLVRKREYSSKATISFEPQYSLGRGIDAAIEFDGVWLLKDSYDNHTLETEEFPWVFWLDEENTLWAQYGVDENSRVQLDTEVTSMGVCRGYKSADYPEHDQGLICVYIKDSVAYYRQYAYITAVGVVTWDERYTLYDEEYVNSVHVHRLNDYRIGIVISTDTKNLWYITDRTYVTQATPPERVSYINSIYPAMGVLPADAEVPAPEFTTTWNKDNMTLAVQFTHGVRSLFDDLLHKFTFNGLNVYEDIKDFYIKGNSIIIKLKNWPKFNVVIKPNNYVVHYYVPNVGYYPMVDTEFIFNLRFFEEHIDYSMGISGESCVYRVQYSTMDMPSESVEYIVGFNGSGAVRSVSVNYSNVTLDDEFVDYNMGLTGGNAVVSYVGDEPI